MTCRGTPGECPVNRVIKEIRGSGMFDDDAEDSTARVIKLGGSDGSSGESCVLDEMSFYIMSRRIALARFEISNPTVAGCEAKYKSMFHDIVGKEYKALCWHIIDTALEKKHLYNQFVRLVDLLGAVEELIIARVEALGRAGAPVNVSLPELVLFPHVDRVIVYQPAALAETINQIIRYVNKININSILKEPVAGSISAVGVFSGPALDFSTRIEPISSAGRPTVESYMAGMRKILNQELEVAEYVRELEKYHCVIINHMNRIYDVCRQMVGGLTQ
jgi:hypothetical protein